MVRDRRFWLTALAVAGIVLFALFVRTYWNVEAASPDGTFVLSESDAYYERRTAERIQTSGWQHFIDDPMQNYPVGGINPNPPLWEWWIATWGALLTPAFAGDAGNHPVACPADAQPSQATCVSTWWVAEFSPALFGALIVLLVILVGRDLWGWRAGLFGGFLLATSTSAIERSVFGFADHDAIILFFLTVSFLFFIKALLHTREERWVAHWGDSALRAEGLRRYFEANRLSLAFAALAGVALAGVHLSWKGGAYGAGVFLVYGIVHVLINHWRRRDSTHIFGVVAMALVVSTLLAIPYYANPALGAVFDTLMPLLFIMLAWLAVGILFTAMRDYPFVLVIPAGALVVVLALVAAFFLAPSVAATLLGPLVYFKQTKLYTTIAEAHPADFNTVVFGTGVVAFFFALVALPMLLWENRKSWRPATLFVVIWGVIAIFMTHSAVRFMFNATPVFALLAGFTAGMLMDRLKLESIGKNLRGLGGFSRQAIKRAISPWHVVGTLLIALLLLLPNVMLAVDAGMPSQFEDKLIRDELREKGLPDNNQNRDDTFVGARMGAFGQGFISDYWRQLFEWLSAKDTDLAEEQRPGFLSWWDYGHWAISLGRHPSVADNFQNAFHYAGNFIASQNETHAVQLFIARAMDMVKAGEFSRAQFTQAFVASGLDAPTAETTYDQLAAYEFAPALDLPKALDALSEVEKFTGKRIRYFAMDVRLFPFDNPNTPGIDFGSIFYAPISLAEKNPEDYVAAAFRSQNAVQVPGDATPQREFTSDEYAILTKDIGNLQKLSQVQQYYKYREPFFNSMFYRAYLGTPVGLAGIPVDTCVAPPVQFKNPGERLVGLTGDRLPGISFPAFCMEHFRLVYYDPSVRMIQFYPGATVQGQVTVDGRPVEGAQVLAYDDAGDLIFEDSERALTDQFKTQFRVRTGRNLTARDFDVPHGQVNTSADGSYSLVVPFSTSHGTTLRAFVDGVEVGNITFPVSQEQAEQGFTFSASQGAINGVSGSIEGTVYFDTNHDNRPSPDEPPLAGVRVSLLSDANLTATTDAQGHYRIDKVRPGRHEVQATAGQYEMGQRAEQTLAAVSSGGVANLSIPMVFKPAQVDGTVWRDTDGSGTLEPGEGLRGVRVLATPDFRVANNTAVRETAFSGENGTLKFELSPGTYLLRGEHLDTTTTEGSAFGKALQIAPGTPAVPLTIAEGKLLPATKVTVSLTVESEPGNFTGAERADVLFVPTDGGAPAGEQTPASGNLEVRLVPGTYQVFAQGTLNGEPVKLRAPLTIVVGTDEVRAEGRLEKAA